MGHDNEDFLVLGGRGGGGGGDPAKSDAKVNSQVVHEKCSFSGDGGKYPEEKKLPMPNLFFWEGTGGGGA